MHANKYFNMQEITQPSSLRCAQGPNPWVLDVTT